VGANLGAYFEIPVVDMERAIDFYQALMGVEFARGSIHGYEMAFFPHDPHGAGITGALAKGDVYKPCIDGAFLYLRTEAIDEVLTRAIELGSQVLLEKTVATACLVAEITDSEGNRICLMQDV
jgi:predicted enzyme related to lactoylglutathione lyase